MTWEPLHAGEPFFGADPEGIETYGTALSTTGAQIGTLTSLMRKLGDRNNWESDTADAFRDKANELADLISKAEQRYVDAGKAMTTFGGQLDEHITRAKGLLTDAQEAKALLDSTSEQMPEPGEDGSPGELTPEQSAENRKRADAQADLARLSRDFTTVVGLAQEDADACEKAVNDAREHGADGFWEKHAGWIRVVAAAIAAIAAIALLIVSSPFWVAFVIVVGIIAGLVALAMSIGRFVTGNGPWYDILFDAVGVVTFGTGGLILQGLRAAFPALKGAYATFMAGRASSRVLNGFLGLGIRKGFLTWMANSRIPFTPIRVPFVTRGGERAIAALTQRADLAADAARTAAETAPAMSGVTRFLLGGKESATYFTHSREMARNLPWFNVPVDLADDLSRVTSLTSAGQTASVVGAVNAVGNVIVTGRDTVLDPSSLGAADTLVGIVQVITDLVGRQ